MSASNSKFIVHTTKIKKASNNKTKFQVGALYYRNEQYAINNKTKINVRKIEDTYDSDTYSNKNLYSAINYNFSNFDIDN